VLVSCAQDAGHNENINMDIKFFENVSEYL